MEARRSVAGQKMNPKKHPPILHIANEVLGVNSERLFFQLYENIAFSIQGMDE